MTSLRESQAISSLASLRSPLRELILCRPDFSYEGMNINNIQKKSGSNGQQKLICPVGVSSKLWNALSMKYNNSQLQAITSVVDLPRSIYAVLICQAVGKEKMVDLTHSYYFKVLQEQGEGLYIFVCRHERVCFWNLPTFILIV